MRQKIRREKEEKEAYDKWRSKNTAAIEQCGYSFTDGKGNKIDLTKLSKEEF